MPSEGRALYANENFPLPVVEELRAAGHDVLTVNETGKADLAIADEDVWHSLQRTIASCSR